MYLDITIKRDYLLLKFSYSNRIIKELKRINRSYYDSADRVWKIPLSKYSVNMVFKIFNKTEVIFAKSLITIENPKNNPALKLLIWHYYIRKTKKEFKIAIEETKKIDDVFNTVVEKVSVEIIADNDDSIIEMEIPLK